MASAAEEQREVLEIAAKSAEAVLSSSPPIVEKHVRSTGSEKLDEVKNDGTGDKGACGELLDAGPDSELDPNDPNYDSSEEAHLVDYKKAVATIIEEYFSTGDVTLAATDLTDLGSDNYRHHFVKKLISMAMDRHDKEKEMTSVLLSALYVDVIRPLQISHGFIMLLESVDDLAVDILDVVNVMALFIARAIVDDILPPAFIKRVKKTFSESSKGYQVLQLAEKSYLSAPHHAERLEKRWGGSTCPNVDEVKKKILDLLKEYIGSGDRREACRCIRELGAPFFHHEVVKRSLILGFENEASMPMVLKLLKQASDECLISSGQMTKGFARLAESLDDLALDIPYAKAFFLLLVQRAISEGWLDPSFPNSSVANGDHGSDPVDRVRTNSSVSNGDHGSSVSNGDHGSEAVDRSSSVSNGDHGSEAVDRVRRYKEEAVAIINEYFLSDDIPELITSIKELAAPEFNPFFLKKLITLAMDRKNKEREMASVLISELGMEMFSTDDLVNGFVMLLESAEDTALDILDASNELALFLARAVIDEVLVPMNLAEIKERLTPNCSGSETVRAAHSLVAARHSSERLLRCWGGSSGWAVEDAKEKIFKLLEEYESGGDVAEACRCIRDLDMPFFHHEVVKKALVMAMEKKNERILGLLQECFVEGLITVNQMTKGFSRVRDGLADLSLDVPDAREKYLLYVKFAAKQGWLLPTFEASPAGSAS